METSKVTGKETFSLTIYSLGQSLSMVYVLGLLSIFYTDVLGIAPAMVATIYLVARIWDAVNDPMMGFLVDKAHLRGGRFTPWLRLTSIALPIATLLLFVNIDASPTVKTIYAFVMYIIWGMVYTMSDVPAFAVPTVMTNSVDTRNKLISRRTFGGALAILLGIPLAALVEGVGWFNLAVVYCVIMLIAMLFIRNVKEKVTFQRNSMSIKEILKYIGNNKYLLAFYIGYLLMSAANTGNGLGTYFAKYNLGNLGLASIIGAVSVVPIVFVPLLMPALVHKFGKRKLLLIAMAIGTVLSVTQYFIGYESFLLFLLFAVVKALFLSMPVMMLGMITSDCVEYGHSVTGIRAEGLTFSVQTFAVKLAGAVSGAVAMYLLQYFGYVENAEQSARTLNGIWISTTLLPSIGFVLMFFIVLFFYKLKEEDVQKMIEQNQISMQE